jgi:predicted  nucleic acid-binding Zn-ribbon protein
MRNRVYRKAERGERKRFFATEGDTLWLILVAVTLILVITTLIVRDSITRRLEEATVEAATKNWQLEGANQQLSEAQDRLASTEDEKKQLEQREKELKTQVSELETQASNLSAQLKAVKREKAELKKQEADLKVQVSTQETRASNLNARLADVNSAKAALEQRKAELESQVADLESRLEEAGSGKSAINQLIAVQQKLGQLQAGKAAIEKILLSNINTANVPSIKDPNAVTVETVMEQIAKQSGVDLNLMEESTRGQIRATAGNIIAAALADYQKKQEGANRQERAKSQHEIAREKVIPKTKVSMTYAESDRGSNAADKWREGLVNQWMAALPKEIVGQPVEPMVADLLEKDASDLYDKAAPAVRAAYKYWLGVVSEAAKKTQKEVSQLHTLSLEQVQSEIQKRIIGSPDAALMEGDRKERLSNAATNTLKVAKAEYKALVERQKNLARLTYWKQLTDIGVQNLSDAREVAKDIERIIVNETGKPVQEGNVREAIQKQAKELVRIYNLRPMGGGQLISLRIQVTKTRSDEVRIVVNEGSKVHGTFNVSETDPSSILAGEKVLEIIADRLLQGLGEAKEVEMNVLTEVEGDVKYLTVFAVRSPILNKLALEKPRVKFNWDDIPVKKN